MWGFLIHKTMAKIIDNKPREVLMEGRNYQLGFGFLKKLKVKQFETVQPISPCKDYLNDVVFSEQTGKNCNAHGLHYSKQDAFKTRQAYMAISIMPYSSGDNYPNFEKDALNLQNNIHNVQLFMNNIEKKMGIKYLTKITPSSKAGIYICQFDKYWTKTTYAVSAYSFLLRLSQWYNGVDDVMHYLETFSYFPDDLYLLNGCLENLKWMIENPLKLTQEWANFTGNTVVHNAGIKSFVKP